MASEVHQIVTSIKTSLDKVEVIVNEKLKSIPKSDVVLQNVKSISNNIKKELDSLEPFRSLNVVIVGPTNWGKTSLTRTLFDKLSFEKTSSPKWVEVTNSLNILHTIGMELELYPLLNNFKEEIEKKIPDIVIVVCDCSVVRSWNSATNVVKSVLKLIKSHSIKIPIIWAATKLDNAEEELGCKKNKDFDNWKNDISRLDTLQSTLSKQIQSVFGGDFNSSPLVGYTSTISEGGNIRSLGTTEDGGLLDLINANSPLCAQYYSNDNRKNWRNMAIKIVATFTSINTMIALLPGVDTTLSTTIIECMLGALESFRIQSDRSVDGYKNTYGIMLSVGYALRGVLLTGCLTPDISVSLPTDAAIAASSTSTIGYHAYCYFTGEMVPKKLVPSKK